MLFRSLTFTKKSAKEMKERIVSTLENLEDKEAELNALCETLNLKKEEILEKNSSILESFNHSSISIETIDAFISKILRKFSLHCSLMPDFGVVSSLGELQSGFFTQLIKEKLLCDFVKFCIRSGKKDSDMLEFFNQLWQKKSEFEKCELEHLSKVDDDEVFEKLLDRSEERRVGKEGVIRFRC